MIEFQQVYKKYKTEDREVNAVKPLDLAIKAGEVFGLIGHSGAGKSTLLRLINRLEEPSGGQLLVEGRNVLDFNPQELRSYRRQVGMIFQHFNLMNAKTVAGNIAMPMRLAGIYSPTEIKKRVVELLDLVGLIDQADKYPTQLSGGQKQRVGIARALACRPSILLCDEATSALDPQTTASILELLAEINRELHLTVVLITHEMDVIRRICDRVAVIDAGEIVEMGEVSDVFLFPKHPTTRRFVIESENRDEKQRREEFSHVQGSIVRLTFQGDATYAPILGTVARQTGVDYSILSGRIDHIKNQPYGQLVVALIGGDTSAAIAQFGSAGVSIEVLQ